MSDAFVDPLSVNPEETSAPSVEVPAASEPTPPAAPSPTSEEAVVSVSPTAPQAESTTNGDAAPTTTDADAEAFRDSAQLHRTPGAGPYYAFVVSVSEPSKVENRLVSSYVVYKVTTKTNHPGYFSQESTVLRRFSNFDWLYEQLVANNPGVIVPPLPEKTVNGRFEDAFVENRRVLLETFLSKVVLSPVLQNDPDLKTFLESENFEQAIKDRAKEVKEKKDKGLLRTLGDVVAGSFVKIQEPDEWFEGKRVQIETLEVQLKTLYKSVDSMIKQRKELAGATAEFGEAILQLAGVELHKPLAASLTKLGTIQKSIRDIHENQSNQDLLTIGNTLDEYIRLIGSVKISMNARAKAFQNQQAADANLVKKKDVQEKTRNNPKAKQESVVISEQEAQEADVKLTEARKEFERLSKLVRKELERFDLEKVEDFQQSLQKSLDSMLNSQQQVIKLWESFLPEVETL